MLVIGSLENDDEEDPAAKVTLATAYEAAGLPAEIEVYEGTMHGWCPPDSAVYNEANLSKFLAVMIALFSLFGILFFVREVTHLLGPGKLQRALF